MPHSCNMLIFQAKNHCFIFGTTVALSNVVPCEGLNNRTSEWGLKESSYEIYPKKNRVLIDRQKLTIGARE
jgi:hypothetical protein